jgi:hypothetical protein
MSKLVCLWSCVPCVSLELEFQDCGDGSQVGSQPRRRRRRRRRRHVHADFPAEPDAVVGLRCSIIPSQ